MGGGGGVINDIHDNKHSYYYTLAVIEVVVISVYFCYWYNITRDLLQEVRDYSISL